VLFLCITILSIVIRNSGTKLFGPPIQPGLWVDVGRVGRDIGPTIYCHSECPARSRNRSYGLEGPWRIWTCRCAFPGEPCSCDGCSNTPPTPSCLATGASPELPNSERMIHPNGRARPESICAVLKYNRTRMSKFPIHPKNPERICWGCEKMCPAVDLACGGGQIRTPHPVELGGDDWFEWLQEHEKPGLAPTGV
jgi:hypothetical protein